jgi:hypothetical protein
VENKSFVFEKCSITDKLMFVLESPWNREIEDYVVNNKIDYLYINWTKGWKGKNLDFLKKLNFIRYLYVLDRSM